MATLVYTFQSVEDCWEGGGGMGGEDEGELCSHISHLPSPIYYRGHDGAYFGRVTCRFLHNNHVVTHTVPVTCAGVFTRKRER